MKRFLKVALLAGAPTACLAAHPAVASGPGIEGSWSVVVTTYNCMTGVQNPPFTSLLSFSTGGTEAETTSNPALALGQRSPAFGNWAYKGAERYQLQTRAFILFATAGGPTAPPIPQGTQTITQAITLKNGHSFTSTATIAYYDTSGTLALTGCANAVATRLPS